MSAFFYIVNNSFYPLCKVQLCWLNFMIRILNANVFSWTSLVFPWHRLAHKQKRTIQLDLITMDSNLLLQITPQSVEVQGAVWEGQGQVHVCSGHSRVWDSQTQQENQRCKFLRIFFFLLKLIFRWKEISPRVLINLAPSIPLRSSTRWNTTKPRPRHTLCLMTPHTSSTWRRSKTSPALWVELCRCKWVHVQGRRKFKLGGEMIMRFVVQLKYKEVYEKCKAQINMDPEAHEIRAAKEAYKNITNVSVPERQNQKTHRCSFPSLDDRNHTNSGWRRSLLLVAAWLQEEVRGHQEQVDLDFGQTRLPQCCQEYPATEWCKTVGMEPHQNVTLC